LEECIYELKKIERKMRMFWFDYEGRYITYEEALIEFEHDAEAYPKFKPREGGIFGVKKY
jgi:hypothetical protein